MAEIPIYDPVQAGAIIRDHLLPRSGKSRQKNLARTLGISQPYLSRLINGDQPTIEWDLMNTIRRKLPSSDLSMAFLRAVLPPQVNEIAHSYIEWAQRYRAQLRDGFGSRWERVDGEAPRSVAGETWATARAKNFQRLRKEFASELKAFRSIYEKGYATERIELAIDRILTPLLDQAPSVFVERLWDQITHKDLEEFVKAGIRRESILLDRELDMVAWARAVGTVPVPPRKRRKRRKKGEA